MVRFQRHEVERGLGAIVYRSLGMDSGDICTTDSVNVLTTTELLTPNCVFHVLNHNKKSYPPAASYRKATFTRKSSSTAVTSKAERWWQFSL